MESKKIGLTSVTFRKKGINEIIALSVLSQLDGIEWGGDIHVPCGNLKLAAEVGKKTRDAGLEVFSYGSYYSVGEADFNKVLDTTNALGCYTVRIWAPQETSVNISKEKFNDVVTNLAVISESAKQRNITVCLEYHNGTLNDNSYMAKKLLETVGAPNLKTYWQPIYNKETNLKDIDILSDYIENVHVYKWIYGEKICRKMLSEYSDEWLEYIKILGEKTYLIEFCKDDSELVFRSDVEVIRELFRKTAQTAV